MEVSFTGSNGVMRKYVIEKRMPEEDIGQRVIFMEEAMAKLNDAAWGPDEEEKDHLCPSQRAAEAFFRSHSVSPTNSTHGGSRHLGASSPMMSFASAISRRSSLISTPPRDSVSDLSLLLPRTGSYLNLHSRQRQLDEKSAFVVHLHRGRNDSDQDGSVQSSRDTSPSSPRHGNLNVLASMANDSNSSPAMSRRVMSMGMPRIGSYNDPRQAEEDDSHLGLIQQSSASPAHSQVFFSEMSSQETFRSPMRGGTMDMEHAGAESAPRGCTSPTHVLMRGVYSHDCDHSHESPCTGSPLYEIVQPKFAGILARPRSRGSMRASGSSAPHSSRNGSRNNSRQMSRSESINGFDPHLWRGSFNGISEVSDEEGGKYSLTERRGSMTPADKRPLFSQNRQNSDDIRHSTSERHSPHESPEVGSSIASHDSNKSFTHAGHRSGTAISTSLTGSSKMRAMMAKVSFNHDPKAPASVVVDAGSCPFLQGEMMPAELITMAAPI